VTDDFPNVYADPVRAGSYAELGFPATYHLAFRDLPHLLDDHVSGTRALDFGCGAGRSSRFLKKLGYDVTGVDISGHMVDRARAADPAGDYRLLDERGLDGMDGGDFDLILCAFTFDNVVQEMKATLCASLASKLGPRGRLVNLVSAVEIYLHEWASFSTKDFPGNRTARTGDPVHIVMLDVEDRRPVNDILCTDDAYRTIYAGSGLTLLETHRPMALPTEPFAWVSETRVSPWAIYVLARTDGGDTR
jgi:SAM-dependent methyltransferase